MSGLAKSDANTFLRLSMQDCAVFFEKMHYHWKNQFSGNQWQGSHVRVQSASLLNNLFSEKQTGERLIGHKKAI